MSADRAPSSDLLAAGLALAMATISLAGPWLSHKSKHCGRAHRRRAPLATNTDQARSLALAQRALHPSQ